MIKKVSDLNSFCNVSRHPEKVTKNYLKLKKKNSNCWYNLHPRKTVYKCTQKYWCCVKVPAIFVQLCVCIMYNM